MSCKKCGSEDINTVYCDGKDGYHQPCSNASCSYVPKHKEHLVRNCRDCQHCWSDPCKDSIENVKPGGKGW